MTTLVFDDDQLPGVSVSVRRAAHAINADGRAFACRHVLLRFEPSYLDAQQPSVGLRCYRCAKKDLARHCPVEESTCDECGAVGRLLHGTNTLCTAVDLEIRDTHGHRRRFTGPIIVFGAGFCVDCRARIEERAA